MRRPAILILLVVALAWQSFAAVASTVSAGGRADVVHSVMHWQEIPHHHGHLHDHGDGTPPHTHGHDSAPVHVDDSDESQAHVSADHCGSPGFPAPIRTSPFVPGESHPAETIVGSVPHPPFDGPFRPPRLTA